MTINDTACHYYGGIVNPHKVSKLFLSNSGGFNNSTYSTLAELGKHARTHKSVSLNLCHRAIILLKILCFGLYL